MLVRPMKKITKTTCNTDDDCNERGRCSDEGRCMCEPGWITFPASNSNNEQCLYEQSSKVIALILSLLIGTLGADWFYLSRGSTEYIIIGIIKLFLASGCCLGIPLVGVARSNGSAGCKVISLILTGLLVLAMPVWCIIDWIRILVDKFPDGNGAPLQSF